MKIKKMLILTTIMGLLYLDMELFMRAFRGELFKIGFNDIKYSSLIGWTSLWSFFIGGFSGLFIGLLNEGKNKFKKFPILFQSLIGMIFIFTVEFLLGYILNIKLELNLWSYKNWPLNILGQITLLYIPLWFFIVPFVIWIDDMIRYCLFDDDKPYNLFKYYINLFKGK